MTPALAAALVGSRKPAHLRAGVRRGQRAGDLHAASRGRSWPATPCEVTADPDRRPVSGASSSTRTSGRTAARTGTASPSGTGSTARRTTCTTCQGCGWSRWTRPAAPAAPTAAWTRTRRAGWRTGSPRCTAEVELPDGTHRRTGNEDRLVVLFSHHGVDTLAGAPAHAGPGRCPPARRPGGAAHRAPVPQRRALAQRAHAHELGAPAPAPGRTRAAGSGRSRPARSSTGRARAGWSSCSTTATGGSPSPARWWTTTARPGCAARRRVHRRGRRGPAPRAGRQRALVRVRLAAVGAAVGPQRRAAPRGAVRPAPRLRRRRSRPPISPVSGPDRGHLDVAHLP